MVTLISMGRETRHTYKLYKLWFAGCELVWYQGNWENGCSVTKCQFSDTRLKISPYCKECSQHWKLADSFKLSLLIKTAQVLSQFHWASDEHIPADLCCAPKSLPWTNHSQMDTTVENELLSFLYQREETNVLKFILQSKLSSRLKI